MNQCRSCHMSSQLRRVSNQCKCPTLFPFLSLQAGSCLQKCGTNEYYDFESQACIVDTKIEGLFQYFWNDYDFNGWNLIENSTVTSLTDKIYISPYGKVVGLLLPTQSINYKFNNVNQFQTLRIRADIYIYQSTKIPQIFLQVDKINKLISPKFNNTFTGYQLYQIDEVMDCEPNSNITFSISNDPNTRWGINSIVLNQNNCQSNCQQCASKLTCGKCNSGYYLYEGQCLTSCPKYTSQLTDSCSDVSESYGPQTSPLLRAFDDNIISNFVIKNTNSILSYNQTKYGTYYNGLRYFGGLKDNHNQFYKKEFYTLPPHYAIILQFNIATFQFPLASEVTTYSGIQNNVNLFYDKQDLLTIPHVTDPQNISITFNHQSNYLALVMLSIAKDSTYFSFGISDLNIMIQRCAPLCRKCNGPASQDCKEWIYEQNSNGNTCNSGFIFDVATSRCVLCPIGCSVCSDKQTCSVCDANYVKQGSSCYCQNGYIDEFTLNCILNA